eukprot:1097652-Pelagomonas_calceolata.AAC.1
MVSKGTSASSRASHENRGQASHDGDGEQKWRAKAQAPAAAHRMNTEALQAGTLRDQTTCTHTYQCKHQLPYILAPHTGPPDAQNISDQHE